MNAATRELIAIGASIGSHCQPCLIFHIERARNLGASEEDIIASVQVGHMVETGSVEAMKAFSAETLADGQTREDRGRRTFEQGGSCCRG